MNSDYVTDLINCIDNFVVMYANVDSLPNKLEEVKNRIKSLNNKPDVIALTEVKHKNKWNMEVQELQIDGYQLYSNNLNGNSRGIIIYVNIDIYSKQIVTDDCSECLLLELNTHNNSKLLICTIYRSPNSSLDNDHKIFKFIDYTCSNYMGNKLFLGDFNWPHINWDKWCTSNSIESKFLDILRKIFLDQHVSKPTRARGTDTPHLLDLVISDGSFIENIDYDAPFGKSDHCVLHIECNFNLHKKRGVDRFAFSKGDYDRLRNSLHLNWKEILDPYVSDVDKLWTTLKRELDNKINAHIPKIRSFNSWKKESWTQPLDPCLRKIIARKKRLWTRYIETRDAYIHKKYKAVRNKVNREIKKINRAEHRATTCCRCM